jgi:predicted cytidylate kinase
MIITIGGPPGSGKTTVAKLVSKELDLEIVVIGEVFRSIAKERGCTLAEMGEIASKDHSIDSKIDEQTIKIAQKDNIVLEGRLAGVMLHKNNIPSFKVWLDADPIVRAQRIGKREGGDMEALAKRIQEREDCEKKRYMDIYGISLEDKTIYDLIINTSDITPEDIAEIILDMIQV